MVLPQSSAQGTRAVVRRPLALLGEMNCGQIHEDPIMCLSPPHYEKWFDSEAKPVEEKIEAQDGDKKEPDVEQGEIADEVCAIYGFTVEDEHNIMPYPLQHPQRVAQQPSSRAGSKAVPPVSATQGNGKPWQHVPPGHKRDTGSRTRWQPDSMGSCINDSKPRVSNALGKGAKPKMVVDTRQPDLDVDAKMMRPSLSGIRPRAASRAQERQRLERDIMSLKNSVVKNRPSSKNDSLKLSHMWGSHAYSAASALEKTYLRDPEILYNEFKKDFVMPELANHRQEVNHERGRTTNALCRRRALSADPDSPSRKSLLREEFQGGKFLSDGTCLPRLPSHSSLQVPTGQQRRDDGKGRLSARCSPRMSGFGDSKTEISSYSHYSRVNTPSDTVARCHLRPPRPFSAKMTIGGGVSTKLNAAIKQDDLAPRQVLARDAATKRIQTWVKTCRQRAVYKRLRKEKLFSLTLVQKYKASLLSERNALWTACTKFANQSVISAYLAAEGEDSQKLLEAMSAAETADLAIEEANAAAKLESIVLDEVRAEKEKSEMVEAEAKLKKEEAEALDWQARAEALESDIAQFEAKILAKGGKVTKHEHQLLQNKKVILEKIKSRAGRELDQYKYALKVWIKERDEAVAAVEVAQQQRKEWESQCEMRRLERCEREKNRLDMPFRDTHRSVLQKLRACNHDLSDPSSIIHPALPMAFFVKQKNLGLKSIEACDKDTVATPRTPSKEVSSTDDMPSTGVAVVLASDTSRFEGDWHQMRHPGDVVLLQAFMMASDENQSGDTADINPSSQCRLAAGIAPPVSPARTETGYTVMDDEALRELRLGPTGFQAAMESIGRAVTDAEAQSLVYYFDQNENGSVDFHEFKRGVERLVGSGCPHGAGKEHLVPQDVSKRSIYIGDFHDDKRHGCGLFKSSSGWGYLGLWSCGSQDGSGFEVVLPPRSAFDDAAVPMLVSYVKMKRGKLEKRQRFDDKSVAQARLLRRIGLSIDRALKRAALARRLAYKCCQEGLDDCEGWELVESREQMCNSAHKIRQNSS